MSVCRVLVFWLSLIGAGSVHAAGFQVFFEQSAAAMGQAAAVVARVEGPSSLFYNPASICALTGSQFDLNFDGLSPKTEYHAESPEATTSTMSDGFVPIAAAHATHRVNRRLAVGLGLNTPYGSKTEWSRSWEGRYHAVETSLTSLYLSPTIGVRLRENFSLGIAPLLVWSRAQVSKAIDAPRFYARAVPEMASVFLAGAGSPENDVWTDVEGDDWGGGARIGLRWDTTDRIAVGLAYQSKIDLHLRGEATYRVPDYQDEVFGSSELDATATQLAAALFPESGVGVDLTLPSTLTGGIAFLPHDHFSFEVDLMWTGWASYDSLTIVYESLAGQNDVSSSEPKSWNNTMTFRLGVEIGLHEHVVGRLGYAFDESPIPDTTRDPSLAGSDRHDLSLGLGLSAGRWSVDAAYLYAAIKDMESQLRSELSGDLLGSYESSAHLLSMAASVRF